MTSCKLKTQVIPNSNTIRNAMASNKPILRAFGWSFGSNFPETMDRKTMLSIPKIISKKVNVNKATQAFGLEINSIIGG